MKYLFLATTICCSLSLFGQGQIDFRGQVSLNIEKKISPGFSVTTMLSGIWNYDFQELGFAYTDWGLKYKLNRNFGVNVNYRWIKRRNLDNFYDDRQQIYADLDFSKSKNNWSWGGTMRLQGLYYSRLLDSYKEPRWYWRTRVNTKYKLNYYYQLSAEAEIFYAVNRNPNHLPNQWRCSFGITRTINRYMKLELYEQVQRQINVAAPDLNFLTALNISYRF